MNEFKSTLSDTDILQGTVRGPADEKGRVMLQYRIEEDKVVSSAPVVEEELKGGVLIAWCNAVRAEEEMWHQDKEARKSRDYTPEAVEEKTRSTLPDDPLDMISTKIADLSAYVENLEGSVRGYKDDLKRAKNNLKKWEAVRDTLNPGATEYLDDIPTG